MLIIDMEFAKGRISQYVSNKERVIYVRERLYDLDQFKLIEHSCEQLNYKLSSVLSKGMKEVIEKDLYEHDNFFYAYGGGNDRFHLQKTLDCDIDYIDIRNLVPKVLLSKQYKRFCAKRRLMTKNNNASTKLEVLMKFFSLKSYLAYSHQAHADLEAVKFLVKSLDQTKIEKIKEVLTNVDTVYLNTRNNIIINQKFKHLKLNELFKTNFNRELYG